MLGAEEAEEIITPLPDSTPSPPPDPPAPSPMDDVLPQYRSSFSSTVIRRAGSEEQQQVMSRVEEAVLRLYQRRVEEAGTASIELEGLQRHVATWVCGYLKASDDSQTPSLSHSIISPLC